MTVRSALFYLLILIAISLQAQPDDIIFRMVSPPGGYSFHAINSIQQDLYGYIWMGDQNGVIRYDSRNIERYIHKPSERDGLPSDRITAIATDKQNNIWVGTQEGFCKFNRELNKFERVRYRYENGDEPNHHIHSVELDGDDNLWICDDTGFGYLDEENNKLVRIKDGLEGRPRVLYNDEINRMWIGTIEGEVYQVYLNQKSLKKIIESPGSAVRTIYATNDEIWVGYNAHGAWQYDTYGKAKKHYTYTSSPEFDIANASIRKIIRDTRGRIWIGSYLGLYLSTGNDIIRFNPDDYSGLPHNSIYTISEDSQGGIWIGTWSGGVAYMHHADNRFVNYRYSDQPDALSNNMVSSFAQLPTGEIYVGTEVKGLNKFNIRDNSFQKIQVTDNEGILDIKTLHTDNMGGLWVGTAFEAVYYRPPGSTRFIHFPVGEEDGRHVSSVRVYAFCESDSGVWIGANTGALDFYSFRSKKISFISKDNASFRDQTINVRSLYLDEKGTMWIATLRGMYQYQIPTNVLKKINANADRNSNLRDIEYYFVDGLADGKIWMGRKGGAIVIYDPRADQFTDFDANGILKGKDVYGIINGQNNDIWITSNSGLILYNTINRSCRKFIYSDGIQGNLFNPGAIFRDNDDNVFFGGTNGFTLLKPGRINLNQRAPNVLISSIEVHNRKITPHQVGDNVFNKVILQPGEKTLKIVFSANNYLLPDKNRFRYKLDNYLDEWVEVEYDGSATFVNLPAGNYTFSVRACNNDGIWNETAAKLPIEIRHFWYESHVAILLYGICVILIIYFVSRTVVERTRLKKAIAIEKIEREHEENLHEMKLKFFTNISHEFRTPLTLINWPLKQILKSSNLTEQQRDQLNTIKRNTSRMLQLINQIMDIRKVERGKVRLNLARIDLIEFTEERILHFSEEARSKNIRLNFEHQEDSCMIDADEEKLDKIIFNLLSNAFKFTQENGNISVSIGVNGQQNRQQFSNQLSFGELQGDDYIEISITDDGEGIQSENLANIFDRFERANSKKSKTVGTGIGLNLCKDYTLLHQGMIIVQTTPGSGTRFSVRIPKRQRAQKILYESHEEVKNIGSWEYHTQQSAESGSPGEKSTILIVEDNEELLQFMVEFLEHYYHIHFARNGKKGLKQLELREVDLIISDVMMPEMDGFEFCQKVKSQMHTSHIPMILLTALSSDDNRKLGLDSGADAYIPKPFDENMLLSQINNLLLQRRRIKDNFTSKFLSQQPIEVGNLDNYFLNKINATIEAHINDEAFSVDMLASELDLSRSQLHRKLKQITNHSATEYVTMVKVQKATKFLASRKYTIDEVAFKAGFNSHSYFNKCFKKIHNMSPKEYLKQL